MVVVETARGVTTRVRFLPLILTSLGSKSGTPLYLNQLKTCQHYFEPFDDESALLELHARRADRTCDHSRNASHVLRISSSISGFNRLPTPVTDHQKFRQGEIYGLGRGVGRGLAVGPDLGVGVGRGVAVAVAVAVGLAVGVGPVGVAVGVGVGVPPPTAAKISTRPQP